MSIVRAGLGAYKTSIIEATDQFMAESLFQRLKPDVIISDIQKTRGDTRGFLEVIAQGKIHKVLVFSSNSKLLLEVKKNYQGLGWRFVDKNDRFWLRQFGEVVKHFYSVPSVNE